MPNSFDELRKKNQQRSYAHFGRRGSMKNEWIWEYITDPEKVKKHNFYPFIYCWTLRLLPNLGKELYKI